jgi:hypothetical protein
MKPKRPARNKRPPRERDPKDGQEIAERSAEHGVPEEELQGPPARETVLMRSEAEIRSDEETREARLTAGDVDADWQRAGDVGEEAAGGSVATPDQDRVDEIGRALGVPQGPDAEVRTSAEILEGRDRNRWEQEPSPGGEA